MRTIDGFLDDNLNNTILCHDEPSEGGACHLYTIGNKDNTDTFATIKFQKGPVSEHGVNGIQDKQLLEICRDRLAHFQDGEYACEENAEMLAHLDQVLAWDAKRTAKRKLRGVEGTSQK